MGRTEEEVTVVRLTQEPITLGQLLKRVGVVDTGGAVKALLLSEDVRVGGEVETRRGRKLFRGQEVDVAGRRIRLE